MASIIPRRNRFCVVYAYTDASGKKRQKWETYPTMEDAKKRKTEIEYNQMTGSFTIPECSTISELLDEYVELYGKTKWSISMYTSNTGLIRNYIKPIIGKLKLNEVTSRSLEQYYKTLQKTPAVQQMCKKKYSKETAFVTTATIKKIHNLLRSAFTQAEKWDLIEKNPAHYATLPKHELKERQIWDAPTLFKAIECCNDPRLKLCLNLAFSCSLRIGELLALTWDCVDITDESIATGKASIFINKELQRVKKATMNTLESRDIIFTFPEQGIKNTTALVLKKPKTATSTRKVFLPKTVAEMLVAWKLDQDATIQALGNEYMNFNLVIATPMGMPTESSVIHKAMKDMIEENNLPPVVFHSLRHSSITYKLKLTGGDIKAVQGDSGHAQAAMVTDQYSHILDENRRTNAELIEKAFYAGKGSEPEDSSKSNKIDKEKVVVGDQESMSPERLAKLLSNPEVLNMLKVISQSINS